MPVVPTLAQDYPEWHQGRAEFSLWYLEISSSPLLDYLDELRSAFSDILFQPNTRQFHITLFICGFLSEKPLLDDDFAEAQLQSQIQQLEQLNLAAFQLKTGSIRSFESALFIDILDPDHYLERIRDALYDCSDEVAPLRYCPHITIGLYSKDCMSNEIFSRIAQLKQYTFDIDISHLTFGCYRAQQLQGPLSAMHHIQLDTL